MEITKEDEKKFAILYERYKEDEKKFAILYERYMEKKNKEEFEALRKKVAKINEVNKMAEELFCKQGLEESMED